MNTAKKQAGKSDLSSGRHWAYLVINYYRKRNDKEFSAWAAGYQDN
ncbi:MAG TPA: hypothetical protein PK509_11580 [Catalimonadaceae bacterium]|nr:hypothetical protein [Catalimonadaceae bacterium]